MDLFSFLLIYVGAVGAVIFILLFGESPAFSGTPVEGLHWIFFTGIPAGLW